MIQNIFDKLGGKLAVEKFLQKRYPELSGGGMTPGGSVLQGSVAPNAEKMVTS